MAFISASFLGSATHGSLSGLALDSHTQYQTDAEADARYGASYGTTFGNIFGSSGPNIISTWTPYLSGGGGTWACPSSTAKYIQMGKTVFYMISTTGWLFTGTSSYLTFTLPVAKPSATHPAAGAGSINDSTAISCAHVNWSQSSITMRVTKYDGSTLTASVTYYFAVFGTYEAA